MTAAVTAWSYSRYALWERCPLAFKLKHIDKIPEEQSPAMARGDAFHKAAAAYLTEQTPVMPPEAKRFEKLMAEIRSFDQEWKVVEQQWGFTKNWQPTGWFGKDTWFRAILDVGVIYPFNVADVIDHKTGKKYGSNAEQMELFALATFCRYPQLESVMTRLWYHDSGDEETAEFTQDDRSLLIAKWDAKVAPMFADTVFAPKPNDKCRWCSFSKSKGGQCRFG